MFCLHEIRVWIPPSSRFTGFESLAGSPRGRAERDAPNRLLSSCHTEEIEILTTQARGLKEEEEEEEEEEDSPKGSQSLERKEERELSAVAMALAVPQIMTCCGSTRFATEMALVGPFSSLQSAIDSARDIWWNKVDIPGWLEAFSAHPRIGDIQALRTKFSSESSFCEGEQSSALNSSNEHILQELAELNRQYEAKFGFVFLVCASGKSSAEILSILKARFRNRPIMELQIAAAEQQKITELRLAKLMSVNSQLSSSAITEGDTMQVEKATSPTDLSTNQNLGSSTDNSSEVTEKLNPATSTVANLRPPITTHVLDVTLGRPGSGIDVALHWWTQTSPSAEKMSDGDENGFWVPLGKSVTNNDGRAGPLMPTSNKIQPGIYRLTFNTGTYLTRTNSSVNQQEGVSGGFYPYVMIVFEVKPSQVSEHFHVPVLLSPYSFSTYRGS